MAIKLSLQLEDVRGALLDLANASSEAGDPAQAGAYSDLSDVVETAQSLIKTLEAAAPTVEDLIAWVR